MNKYIKYCILPAIAASTIFYVYLSFVVSANSDNMSSLLIAKDIAEGNLRLDGWSMSTQSYLFSDIIWTALVIKMVGYHPIIVHAIPGVLYCFISFAAIRLASLNGIKSALLILPTILIPTYFTVENSVQLNIHIGIYALAAFLLLVFNSKKEKINFPTIVGLSIIAGLFAESDKLLLVIFILPVMIASLLHSALFKRHQYLKFLAFAFLSAIFYKLFGLLNPHIFSYTTPGIGSQGFASVDAMFTNTKLLLDGCFRYFGADPKNDNIPVNIFRVLCLVSFVMVFSYSAISRWKSSLIDTILVLSSLMPVCAFIFSTVAVDANSTRFVFFAFYSSSILIARTVVLKKEALIATPVIIALSLANLATFTGKRETGEKYYARLGAFLEHNNLKYGYAWFWSASITSAISNVHVYPVEILDGVKPMMWLSKKEWFSNKGNFVLTRNAEEYNAALNQFGTPAKIIDFEKTKILVWNTIIFPPNGYSISRINKGALPTISGEYKDGEVRGTDQEGFVLFGPYIPLNKGTYKLTIKGHGSKNGDVIDIVDNSKSTVIYMTELSFDKNGEFSTKINLPEDFNSVELRVHTKGNPDLAIKGYSIIPE